MRGLTNNQAVERLSQITARTDTLVLARALRLALGQRRFTEVVMNAQHHLMTEDMERVVISYRSTLNLHADVRGYLDRRKEDKNEATRRIDSSKQPDRRAWR